MHSVLRHSLPNGLLILLEEDHNAPIISHWVWYRVGSRDEIPGKTGISHWVEHMQFKGTSQYPAGVLDKAVSREGGYWNALTFLDWTTYFETMPADKIDLALKLEADRMVNSLFDPAEVEAERTVIISERQGNENEPMFLLGEEVQSAAFRVHSYHHEVVGDMADLHTIQRDDLHAHYRSFYSPGNAVVAVAGDFAAEQMLERLIELYEPIPAAAAPVRRQRPEPPQRGERRLIVEGPGETTYLQVVYKAPAAHDPDFIAFMVLDSLLSGPSNLNLFGDGISNKTSRLYRAMVERELAISVHGSLAATIDPYLYTLTAVVHPQCSPQKVIAALDAEIRKIRDTAPDPQELRRAVKQAHALFAYGNERITNHAFWLGFSEMIADYSWYENYLSRLEAVTPEDVQRIAQTRLRSQQRVLGIYKPAGQPAGRPSTLTNEPPAGASPGGAAIESEA
jgi:zinc protease